eukprot:1157515-Pelagomonas_calceolata.AAC.6
MLTCKRSLEGNTSQLWLLTGRNHAPPVDPGSAKKRKLSRQRKLSLHQVRNRGHMLIQEVQRKGKRPEIVCMEERHTCVYGCVNPQRECCPSLFAAIWQLDKEKEVMQARTMPALSVWVALVIAAVHTMDSSNHSHIRYGSKMRLQMWDCRSFMP